VKKIKNTLKFLSFFAISAFLFWLIYKDQNITEIMRLLKNDVNYFWIVFSLFLGLLSHISRTIRWNILIKSIEGKSNFTNSFLAVMIGYFANLALPRAGEFTRCGVLSKYEDVSFSKLLGTVFLERVIDLIMFLILMIFVTVSQFDVVVAFFNNNPEISDALEKVFSNWTILISLVVLFLLIRIFRSNLRSMPFYNKFKKIFSNIGEGFQSVMKLEHKLPFIIHSVFIWLMYYLMLYVCFFAFDFTSGLSPLIGLTVFAMATVGMVIPVQGGIGAWHFMVIATLMIYIPGRENVDGLLHAFAFLVHGSMTFMLIILGSLSLVVIPFVNKKKNY